ncbi:unnamed protein product [Allacma fusca]|uniref:Uncharacterized protein n=1 Tax=Allacma fusca TaxID=39272 RepID=A0A8J2PHX7_9HEXA|nr:unnamed protein product [Allacma fusca]
MTESQNSSKSSDRGLRADKRNHVKAAKFDLEEFVEKTNERLKNLEEENAFLKKQVAEMKCRTLSNRNDQEYDRKNLRTNNIMISGLDEVKDNSTPEEAKIIVQRFIKTKLKVSDKLMFKCDVIIPKGKQSKPSKNRPIIKCRFQNANDSNKIRAKRKEVINSTVWINEDLTPYQSQVVKKLLEKRKEFTHMHEGSKAHIYANRYLITRTSNGRERIFESDGTDITEVNSIPGLKPKST